MEEKLYYFANVKHEKKDLSQKWEVVRDDTRAFETRKEAVEYVTDFIAYVEKNYRDGGYGHIRSRISTSIECAYLCK